MLDIQEFLKGLFPVQFHDRIFLAGGIVRDFIVGKSAVDIDLVAALSPGQLTALGFRPVEAKSAAPIYFRHHQGYGNIEVTLISDPELLAADLGRRDFTINAMAMNLSGEVLDPLGGRVDAAEGKLRACSSNAFLDDPVRIFRAFRFEADGWRMTPETVALIRERDWSSSLDEVPIERFSQEMLKSMVKRDPACFFLRMLSFDVGRSYLPELFQMVRIPAGPPEHHPEGDLLVHSIQVLQRVADRTPDLATRFYAMFHDLGKLATDPGDHPRHHGHEEAGYVMARDFCNRLRLSATLRKGLMWTSRLHGKVSRWNELRDSTRLEIVGQSVRAGIGDSLLQVAMADYPEGVSPADWHLARKVLAMNVAELGIISEGACLLSENAGLHQKQVVNWPSLMRQKRVDMLRAMREKG
jgi:tRNA nucleotidyltransferase (CCA-adding enzyme)